MTFLASNSKAKRCCQTYKNGDSRKMPLRSVNKFSILGVNFRTTCKTSLDDLPTGSDEIGGSTRVAIRKIAETNRSPDTIGGLGQIVEFGTGRPGHHLPSGCWCSPSDNAHFFNVETESKFGVNAGNCCQIDAHSSERISHDNDVMGYFQTGGPVCKISQIAEQNGSTAESDQVHNILLERQPYEQCGTQAHQEATKDPTVSWSELLNHHFKEFARWDLQ